MGSALVVAGSWALVSIVVALVVGGAPGIGEFWLFLLPCAPTLLTALAVRFVARGRGWPFWLLLVAAAPVFWVLHALQNLIVG
jgi:hypothetical protein